MRTFLAPLLVTVLSLILGAPIGRAQGSQGALSLEREYLGRIDELRKQGVDEESIAKMKSTWLRTREPVEEVPRSASDLIGEANIALLGGSSVKPGVMATAEYKRNDFLSFGAQLLFGDTGGDDTQQAVSDQLFVPEASKYALNLLGVWKVDSKGEFWRSFAFNFGFYYAQKELPGQDESPDTDTGVIHGHLGIEGIITTQRFSVYANLHYLADHQNVAEYQAYFGPGAKDEFLYIAPGVRAKFSDKLFVDMELICLTDGMNTLSGVDDGILPLFRIGFTQGLSDFN